MGKSPILAEESGKGRIAPIETAGIGAESRHDAAVAVTDETTPPDRTGRAQHTRHGMQVSGDFMPYRAKARLMPKGNRAKFDFVQTFATEIGRYAGIVVAGDPDPVAAALQAAQGLAVGGGQTAIGPGIVKGIAERHATRGVDSDEGRKARQGRGRIVRRQKHPPHRVG